MKIILTDKDLNTNLTASGQAIDVLALGLKQWTQDELQESNIDNEYELANQYVIENYDYEAKVIDWLNNNASEMTTEFYGKYIDYGRKQKKAKQPVLKAGAWLALNHPVDFDAELSNYRDEMQEKCKYEYYQVDEKDIAYELAQECQKAVDAFQAQNYKEWLYGDYRNFAGILKMSNQKYGCESTVLDEKTGNIVMHFTDEQGIEYLSDRTSEDVTKPNWKKLKADLIDGINFHAENHVAEQKAQNAKRHEEYKRVQAYKAEREAQEKAERKEKLMKMINQ